jgi:hypothetical protein
MASDFKSWVPLWQQAMANQAAADQQQLSDMNHWYSQVAQSAAADIQQAAAAHQLTGIRVTDGAQAFRDALREAVDGMHAAAEKQDAQLASMQWATAGDGSELPITVAPPSIRVCACGAEIREPAEGWKFGFPFKFCGDCRAEKHKAIIREGLDARILAAKVETPRAAWDWDERDAEYEL